MKQRLLSSFITGSWLLCYLLAITSFLVTTVKCLPVGAGSVQQSTTTPTVDQLLRLYNVSREDIESSRQQHLAASHSSSSASKGHFIPVRQQQQQQPVHNSETLPVSASDVQQAIRDRSNVTANKSSSAARNRLKEVYLQVMNFVNQNGRPPAQFPNPGGSSMSSSVVAPPMPPFSPPRPDSASPDGYGHGSVDRVRYIQPSCDSPKHADEEIWSSSPLSLHLFFNLSAIQSQTRHGFQLYVIGAKLRLLKFAEGETGSESGDVNSGSQEPPIQTLKASPFFDPLTSSDEEKIRVSVHNYTRALKRNRVHKKKLLDSQMALAKEEGYMELDIKLAARWWLAPGGRNFGLSLEVEDTDGQRKPASRFFRPRNCTSDGSVRTDELTDPADISSPVLELTVVEVPEGRNVLELPSSAVKNRMDESEIVSDDVETLSEVSDEVPRKHRHHSSRMHSSHEEQADEAFVRVHHQPRHQQSSFQVNSHGSKHRTSHRGHHGARPSTSSPVPTLATLEDHDLLRETEDEESVRVETDEMRMNVRPNNPFIQRMLQHRHQQHSRLNHHPRAKDNRRVVY